VITRTTGKGQAYECKSCGGIYYPYQTGGYFHACPSDTAKPRDENIDDTDPENVQIKAKGQGRKQYRV